MELDSVEEHVRAWYRLVGSISTDSALTDQGETAGDVAYIFLTRGCRAAQRLWLGFGYGGWRQRSDAAITWSGSDATTGGRYWALPTNFLRAAGNRRKSPLVQVNGDRWGRFVEDENEEIKGDGYSIRGEQLWLARNALPPTVDLEFHYQHPVWDDDLDDDDIDFPIDSRFLIVAKAADLAKSESWYVGGPEEKADLREALRDAKEEARKAVRQMRQQKRFQKKRRFGNHY